MFIARITLPTNMPLSATFPALKLESCVGYEVQARGSRGSSAIWNVIPECPNGEPEPLMPLDPIPGKR